MIHRFDWRRMKCRECPMVSTEFDRLVSLMKDFNVDDELEKCCSCDKVGGDLWRYGQCEDANIPVLKPRRTSSKKRRNKRERDTRYKAHLKKLSEDGWGWYPTPAYPVDKYGNVVFDYVKERDRITYYKRQYRAKRKTSVSRFFKNYSNRVVRRYDGIIPSGGSYKKVFDYWWQVC